MVIALSNTLKHPAQCEKKSDYKDEELKEIVLKSIDELGINPEEINWNEHGHLEVKKPNDLKLHTLLLRMEELGLELKMTRKTLIEIC